MNEHETGFMPITLNKYRTKGLMRLLLYHRATPPRGCTLTMLGQSQAWILLLLHISWPQLELTVSELCKANILDPMY